jgi:hypothetical protein
MPFRTLLQQPTGQLIEWVITRPTPIIPNTRSRRPAHADRRPATLSIAFNDFAAGRRARLPCATLALCFFKKKLHTTSYERAISRLRNFRRYAFWGFFHRADRDFRPSCCDFPFSTPWKSARFPIVFRPDFRIFRPDFRTFRPGRNTKRRFRFTLRPTREADDPPQADRRPYVFQPPEARPYIPARLAHPPHPTPHRTPQQRHTTG